MEKPDMTFQTIADKIDAVCTDLNELAMKPGPTRCIAKMSRTYDPRIGQNKEYPICEWIIQFVNRVNGEQANRGKNNSNLMLLQDYGSIVLLSGFKEEPSQADFQEVPIVLTSHADEITFIKKKTSSQLLPLCNVSPLGTYRIWHREVKIFGYEGAGDEREFREVGSGNLRVEKTEIAHRNDEIKLEFFLEDVNLKDSNRDVKEGDVVIQNYNDTSNKCDTDAIIHAKALDDRVGVLADLYAMSELNKYGIKAKAILVGDEEGINADVSWARLARPVFRKYCKEENIILLCDGFDGKKLSELKGEGIGRHFDKALIVPYRSEGKGAGDPGLFALLRDNIINLSKEHGFEAVTTTDYVSRSLDPKIMDDFPSICSIDWSNGPIVSPTEKYFNVCHVDESVSVRQVINIIGTTFWAVWFLNKGIENRRH